MLFLKNLHLYHKDKGENFPDIVIFDRSHLQSE